MSLAVGWEGVTLAGILLDMRYDLAPWCLTDQSVTILGTENERYEQCVF